ncbi:MAG: thiamine diphosphokinase [Chloroflexota bacterium]
MPMNVLIFANGDPNPGEMVELVLAQADDAMIIAADGGARVAWHFDKQPQVVIGDMDSLSDDEQAKLIAEGAELRKHPVEKDKTDLELAIIYAVSHGASWIRVLGATGGRFDQMLANIYLLALPSLQDCDVAIVSDNQQMRLFASGQHTIEGQEGDTISLIPVSGDVSGITTENLYYPLDNEMLYFGPARGVSNVMTADCARVDVRRGTLLCVHTKGRA